MCVYDVWYKDGNPLNMYRFSSGSVLLLVYSANTNYISLNQSRDWLSIVVTCCAKILTFGFSTTCSAGLTWEWQQGQDTLSLAGNERIQLNSSCLIMRSNLIKGWTSTIS